MSEIKILSLYKKILVEFFDSLIEQFPLDMELITIRTFIQHQAIVDILMKKFLVSLNKNEFKVKKMIMSRDAKLFLEHNMLFFCDKEDDPKDPNNKMITKENANHFKKLWLSGQLDDDDKKIMWKWLERLVQIAESYENLSKPKV